MTARICSAILLLATGFAQLAVSPFSLIITAPPEDAKAGSEIRVVLALTNRSKRAVTIVRSNPVCDYDVEVRDSSGKVVPATRFSRSRDCGGGHMKGRYIYDQLGPGESMQDSIPVSEAADMSQRGKYSVQVMREAPAELGGAVVKSNLVEITVTP